MTGGGGGGWMEQDGVSWVHYKITGDQFCYSKHTKFCTILFWYCVDVHRDVYIFYSLVWTQPTTISTGSTLDTRR